MNQDTLLDLFDGVRDSYILEAMESQPAGTRAAMPRKKLFLIAAAISLALLLVGCGIVYVLRMQDLKLGDRQVTQEYWDDEQKTMISETVSQQVLTFAGLKGTARYEAAKEWYDFKQTYDPDWKIYHEYQDAGKLDRGPKEYSLYNIYTPDMKAKVDEITAKYSLKLKGAPVKSFDSQGLLDYLGITDVFREEAAVSYEDIGTGYYDGGWLNVGMTLKLENAPNWPYQFLCSLYYSPKDCFDDTICELNETQDWQEWNYTTQSGYEVLVIRSPSVWVSWVFCDRGDATITLRMETILEWYSDDSVERIAMTDEQMKQVIDTIDFSIQPQPGDPALLEAPTASANPSQTSSGYTVEVKEVVTDGHTAKIRLGLTGPEDMDLEQYSSTQGDGSLQFQSCVFASLEPIDSPGGGRSGPGIRADDDGKANTVDFSIELYELAKDGMTYRKGSVWNLYLDGLKAVRYNEELMQSETIWEQEGSWNFQITMDHGDWQELEFISDPITTSACIGWDMDGKDIFEDVTVTSLTLRAFGGNVTSTWDKGQLDFCDYLNEKFPTVVLKDGSTIRLGGDLRIYSPEEDGGRIPLDDVDHLLLMDGTKLYPQQ